MSYGSSPGEGPREGWRDFQNKNYENKETYEVYANGAGHTSGQSYRRTSWMGTDVEARRLQQERGGEAVRWECLFLLVKRMKGWSSESPSRRMSLATPWWCPG